MLNLNYNIIRAKPLDIGIAPILANTFDYLLIGGGGGGNAGGGALGGNGGQGGFLTSGSFSFNHLTTATLTVGNGGNGGDPQGGIGAAGTSSSLVYADSIFTANEGAGGFNTSQVDRGGQTSPITSQPNTIDAYVWSQNGTRGGDSPSQLFAGIGGGTNTQEFPWGISPSAPPYLNAYTNSGGGGGGERWGNWPGGNGAQGMCMLRFFDPRDVFEYTGDWTVFVYENGYKYFYFQNTGTFTFLGKRD